MKQESAIPVAELVEELAPQRRFHPYPEYQDSGLQWLGEIPAHWDCRRLKTSLCRNDGGVWGDDFDAEGTIVLRSTEQTVGGKWDIQEPARRSLAPREKIAARLASGDLLVTKSSGSELHIGKTTIVTPEVEALDCCFSNFMQRIRCGPSLAPEFLYYILNSGTGREQFVFGSNSTTGLANLNGGIIGNLWLAIPRGDEQRAIASFLDRETARIDELIAKKQQLIELLAEKRTALISHAVTGVIVLHEDATWREMQLGRAIKLQRGFDITGASEADGSVPVISSGGFSGFCDVSMVAGPGVIVGRKGTLGTVHYVETDYWPHDTTLWVKQFRGNHPRFVYYFLIHMKLERFDVGAANPTVNRNHVHPVAVLWPDEPTQWHIATFLDEQSEHIAALSSQIERAVRRLHEYRSALISAAVTGKIDVRKEVSCPQ